MSAEQMRVELESFVNKGLKEGLEGWPIKGVPTRGERSPQTFCTTPMASALFHGVKEGPLQTAQPGLEWGHGLIASDVRPAMKFHQKGRFDVTIDDTAPLYW